MAIAIKTIPVLTGDVAERFIEIAESSRNTATTVIPEGAQDAILPSSYLQCGEPQPGRYLPLVAVHYRPYPLQECYGYAPWHSGGGREKTQGI